MDAPRIPRLILGRGVAGPGRSFGARRHVDKKPVSTELTPIPHPSPDSPQQRAVPRKSVVFVKYVTISGQDATHPRLRVSASIGQEPRVEIALV
jgi:hypothetical protein